MTTTRTVFFLIGFLILSLFVPNFANAQYSGNFAEDTRDSVENLGAERDRLFTEMAELIIEGIDEFGMTDEEIDEQLSKMSSAARDRVVEKIQEMGYDYNGGYK